MTVLFIVIAVVLFLLMLLILPVSIRFTLNEKIGWKLYVVGICVWKSDKPKKTTNKVAQEHSCKKTEKKENFFILLKKGKGFSTAVKYCADIAGIILRKLIWYVKTLKFRKFLFELTVASEDAAKTGIEYGAVCVAVYPILAFLDTYSDFELKHISINADFDTVTPRIKLDIAVRTMPLTALIAAFSGLIEYKKLKKESEIK